MNKQDNDKNSDKKEGEPMDIDSSDYSSVGTSQFNRRGYHDAMDYMHR